jgi:hypothetical protein
MTIETSVNRQVRRSHAESVELSSLTVVTQSYDVPAGWLPRSASRGPLLLVNAYAFSTATRPLPDQWMHFAKLRPVPWRLVALFSVIAAFSTWIAIASFVQRDAAGIGFIGAVVLFGLLALFFWWAAVASVVSYRTRTGWPHLHGLGIGESGVAYRLTGGDSDVPWDAVTAIEATTVSQRRLSVPVVRVSYGGSHVDLGTSILGSSPLVLYWALVYYWQNPASRGELGTTVAQQRLDEWLVRATGSGSGAALAA